MKKLIRKLYNFLLVFKLNMKKEVYIDYTSTIRNCLFRGKNKVNLNTVLVNCDIGYGSFIGSECNLYNVKIGKYCSIANEVKVIVGNHPTKKFVSTHPAFYSNLGQGGYTYCNKNYYDENKYVSENYYVEIGNDVWIGADVSILNGVKIGDGVIIGANSLVTKNLDDYGVYAGIPAKKINERFSPDQVDFLTSFQWWNQKEEWISDNIYLFHDIKKFITRLEKEDSKYE